MRKQETHYWGDGTPIADISTPDPWNEPGGLRWVRVMCDLTADGVWDVTGCGRSCDDMPISETLVERIRAWQEWFDREEGNAPISADYLWDTEPFGVEGLAIARAIKSELPDDWIVVYHDIRRWNESKESRGISGLGGPWRPPRLTVR